MYSIDVEHTLDEQEASGLVDAFAAGETAFPGPNGRPTLEVRFFSDLRVVGNDVLVTFVNDDPFTELHLDLNGQVDYATLSAALLDTVNGWYTASVLIPGTDLDFDLLPGVANLNQLHTVLSTTGESQVDVDGSYEFSL